MTSTQEFNHEDCLLVASKVMVWQYLGFFVKCLIKLILSGTLLIHGICLVYYSIESLNGSIAFSREVSSLT